MELSRFTRAAGRTTATLMLASALALPMLPAQGWAQAAAGGVGVSTTTTAQARVVSVDQATRKAVLLTSDGRQIALTAGPEVQNLAQVKAGDMVNVTLRESISYVLTPPSTRLPRQSRAVAVGRAAPGQMPSAAAGQQSVTNSTVVGIDAATKTLQLVDPSGGAVRSVVVTSPEGLQNFHFIKVGDTITTRTADWVAVNVTPAAR